MIVTGRVLNEKELRKMARPYSYCKGCSAKCGEKDENNQLIKAKCDTVNYGCD